MMAKLGMPAEAAKALSVKERVLLFCAAGDTDWRAAVDSEIVTTMIVKGLIVRDAAGDIAPTDRGHAVLRAILHEP
jgi:hypothetical protein